MDEQQEQVPDLPPEPREHMINTAVKFLQNPQVKSGAIAQKRQFLLKKGLTNEEVELAVQKARVVEESAVRSQPYGPPPGTEYVKTKKSFWFLLKEYLSTAVLVGGIAYAAYRLYKYYIEPYFFGPSKEDKKLESLEKSLVGLNSSVDQMLENIVCLKQSVDQQKENIKEICVQNSSIGIPNEMSRMKDERSINDIKTEITSIKGLLLSRKQFPHIPKATPVLPSWQLNSKENEIASVPVSEPESNSENPSTSEPVITEVECSTVEISEADTDKSAENSSLDTMNNTNGAVENGLND